MQAVIKQLNCFGLPGVEKSPANNRKLAKQAETNRLYGNAQAQRREHPQPAYQ